jgi:hypothetical protein
VPRPTPTPIPTEVVANFSALAPEMVLIILLVFAALMFSLWRVFYSYINTKRTTDMHRKLLYDAVYESRYRVLQEELALSPVDREDNGAEWLENQRKASFAVIEENKSRLAMLNQRDEKNVEIITQIKDLKRNILQIQQDLAGKLSEDKISKLREKEEQQKSKLQLQEEFIRSKAASEAESLVPPTLTLAGMGITGALLIELTVILTIIFGIIILGLVGFLGINEIAIIFAALAGYVIGKTTASKRPSMPPPPEPTHTESPPESQSSQT